MPEAELLRRNQQVLQGAAQTQVEFPPVPVGHRLPAREVRLYQDPVSVHLEAPRLGVARGRGHDPVANQKPQLLLDRIYAEKVLNRRTVELGSHGARLLSARIVPEGRSQNRAEGLHPAEER